MRRALIISPRRIGCLVWATMPAVNAQEMADTARSEPADAASRNVFRIEGRARAAGRT